LGEISIPQCLIYLDNSVAFVGSRFGDSQLIKLFTTPVDPATNSFISPIDCYPNISPIRDIAVMESNGQKQIVTASGAFKVFPNFNKLIKYNLCD
jgi:DNA damage-binding protein 1